MRAKTPKSTVKKLCLASGYRSRKNNLELEIKQIIAKSQGGFCYLGPLPRSSSFELGILSALGSEWELARSPFLWFPSRPGFRLAQDHDCKYATPHLASKSP